MNASALTRKVGYQHSYTPILVIVMFQLLTLIPLIYLVDFDLRSIEIDAESVEIAVNCLEALPNTTSLAIQIVNEDNSTVQLNKTIILCGGNETLRFTKLDRSTGYEVEIRSEDLQCMLVNSTRFKTKGKLNIL